MTYVIDGAIEVLPENKSEQSAPRVIKSLLYSPGTTLLVEKCGL
jgi:hypothetical protein